MDILFDILENIPNSAIAKLIPSQCGMPARIKIFPIWGIIIRHNMTEEFKNKTIQFYQILENNIELRAQLDVILTANGDNHMNTNKLDNVKNLINATVTQ